MRTIAIGPLFNEGQTAAQVIQRFPAHLAQEIIIVNDASTDGSEKYLEGQNVHVLSMPKRSGPGTAIRAGIDYGLQRGYEAFVIFATNGKDNPQEISRLLAPLEDGSADFVQGSRYHQGGGWENMPLHRIWGVKAFSILFSLLAGKWISDGTNGFRAIRASLLRDSRINIWQQWLEGYPLETYLFVKAIQLGYKVKEVPVTKTYPRDGRQYTKMKPFVDWWNYFKPIPFVLLGWKK